MCRREHELRQLLLQVLVKARECDDDGPMLRAHLLRWLFYSYITAAQQQAEGMDDAAAQIDTSNLMWDAGWGDALDQTVGLAAELTLVPAPYSDALQPLLLEVVPPGFDTSVAAVAAEQLPPDHAAHVSQRATALSFWQQYAQLDVQYREWKQQWMTNGSQDVGHDHEQAVAAGERLAELLLNFAADDALSMLAQPVADDFAEAPTSVWMRVTASDSHSADATSYPHLEVCSNSTYYIQYGRHAYAETVVPGAI